jgi:arsenite methyltransferase
MQNNLEYDEEESKRTEQAYLSPEVVRQRQKTLGVIAAAPGERIVDIGCGPGLLAFELSPAVGCSGAIVGIDSSSAMIRLANERCCELQNVEFAAGDAVNLQIEDASVDAVCCTQVLLYVADIETAIAEMFRILKPGGRVFVLETDWRSAVLHSNDDVLSEAIIGAWDKAVPSPRLPARLRPLLHGAGFCSVQVNVITNTSTSCEAGSFSMSMMVQCAKSACEQGAINKDQGLRWIAGLEELGERDQYFFCVNRFLFSASKPRAVL